MTRERRQQRNDEIIARTNTAMPAVDPDVQRAVDAVRASTPGTVISMLEDRGLFAAMLEKMQSRFGGRPLGGIRTEELVQIARDSVDEALGFEPLARPAAEFPQPEITSDDEGTAAASMEQLERTVHAWRAGDLSPSESLRNAQRILSAGDEFTP